jgi:hypothetical protein
VAAEAEDSPSSGDAETEASGEGGRGSVLVDQGVEIGVWLVWLVLVPVSVLGIRRYGG